MAKRKPTIHKASAGRKPSKRAAPSKTVTGIADLRRKNAQLTRELREALDRQIATSGVLKVISRSTFDLQVVLQMLTETAARLCDADMASIARQDEAGFYQATNYNFPPDWVEYSRAFRTFAGRGSISGRALLDKKAVQVADVEADSEYIYREQQKKSGYRTFLAVPLLRNGQPVVLLNLGRTSVRPFTEKQIELVSTFADQAVIAIENARLFNEVQARTNDLSESLQQQTATAEILSVISSTPGDLVPVFEAMLSKAMHLCGANFGVLNTFDGKSFHTGATYGLPPAYDEFRRNRTLEYGPGTAPARLLEGEPYVEFVDLLESETYRAGEPNRRALVDLGGARSLLAVPLLKDERVVGSVMIFRQEPQRFPDKQIALLNQFAAQAVIAIENARLLNELRESLQQQTATADVLKVISRSAFDLQTVLDTLVESATRLCDGDEGTIFQPSDGAYRLAAICGVSPRRKRFFENHLFRPGNETTTGRVLLEGRTIHIEDSQTDPDYRLSDPEPVRTRLGVPLLREGAPIGVFVLARREVRPFTEKQIELVQTFADQAVIAIENVRLFDEVQAKTRDLSEALTYQTGSSNILKVIASSPTDAGPVFAAIVESACELCEAYDAVLRLKEGNDLCFSAHQGPIWTFRENWPISRNWTAGRSVIERQPIHVHDLRSSEGDEFPEGRARQQGDRTILSVPLLREGEAIGAITLRRTEVNPFSDKQIALLETFANQAVIAIGNVRLFEEVQARTRDLTESLQQQTATSDVLRVISASPGELEPVFQAMLENAGRLCEAKFAMLFLYEENQFRAVGKWNLPPAWGEFLTKNTILADPKVPLGRVVMTKQPVQVADILLDQSYIEGSPGMVGVAEVGGARTLLQVPMLKENELVGTIGIYRQEVRPFTDKQIALVQNFAAQAVIAVENARLLNELRQRTNDLTGSLEDLRTAQDRLVQTEKLASLGQLTAGIAHEIKNPLNFVNNFAALSAELTDELNDVLKPAAISEKIRNEVDELTGLLKDNLEKVVQHGKRADSIVKNMLLHSREGSGEHRSADINALVEESLNLAYHGARAEKSGFSITFKRDLDPDAGAAEVYPQEVIRALLNLISNGFYAATKRKSEVDDETFEPVLSTMTRNLGNRVEIRIRDNGTGILPDVRDKIFNPFFTTKPVGEGTGLGLSMSHDIIVKQHGGSINVETERGVFTEFIITLPRGDTASDSKPE